MGGAAFGCPHSGGVHGPLFRSGPGSHGCLPGRGDSPVARRTFPVDGGRCVGTLPRTILRRISGYVPGGGRGGPDSSRRAAGRRDVENAAVLATSGCGSVAGRGGGVVWVPD